MPLSLPNILLYVLLVFLLLRAFNMSKGNKKIRTVIEAAQKINQKDEFFAFVNENLESTNDEVIRNKLRIVKMWGEAHHKSCDDFESVLNDLDVNALFTERKGNYSIDENEDSFFYLCLAIPNCLYGAKEDELRKKLLEKLKTYEERLQPQLVYAIGLACEDYYQNTNNQGREFFEKVLEGEYGEFKYSKQLIGIYKNICNAMLVKQYESENNEKLEECHDMVELFHASGVGQRWLNAIDYQLPEEENPFGEEEEKEEKEVIE